MHDHFWDITHSIILKTQAIISILVYYLPKHHANRVYIHVFLLQLKKKTKKSINWQFFSHTTEIHYTFLSFSFCRELMFEAVFKVQCCCMCVNSWPTIHVCTINQRRLWIYQSVFLRGYTIMNLTGQILTITRGRQRDFYSLHSPSFTSMLSKKEYLTIFTDSHQ